MKVSSTCRQEGAAGRNRIVVGVTDFAQTAVVNRRTLDRPKAVIRAKNAPY